MEAAAVATLRNYDRPKRGRVATLDFTVSTFDE
jgi:hypothetical protein